MANYYKVLLVDDEEEIREGMARRVPWADLGLVICGTAENGIEALDLVEKENPDIIITDIQMPFMDGLEFIEQARKRLPLSKFIVFSGYDVFEYAQKSVSLHVTEYLLKPFSAQDLSDVLLKIKQQMDQEKQERRDLASLQARFDESLPLLQQSFLLGCLSGFLPPERILQQKPSFSFSNREAYSLILFEVGTGKENNYFIGREELYLMSIKEFVSQKLPLEIVNHTFIFGEYVVAILAFPPNFEVGNLVKQVNDICREASQISTQIVLAGLSQKIKELTFLPQAFREAQDALTYSYRLDRSEWFATYQKDIAKEQAVTALLLTENEERTFTNLIKLGNKELLTQAINESFKRIKEQHVPLKYYQVYLLEHVTLLLKIAHSYSFEPMDVFGEDLLKMVEDLQKVSLEEMTRWFLTKSQQLNEKIQWSTTDSGKAVIQKAKLLVKEQYSDPELTIEKMSQALFLSPAYFSSLFKKETGQSFISFLTEERLQQARQLMETTNDKSYVVAEKVGYSEPNYFSYVFKKRFGLSPSKYRNQMAKV